MSKNAYPQVDDKMTKVDVPSDVPNGDVQDSSYVSRSGQKDPIPVQRDDAPVKDNIDPAIADTDEQLGRAISILNSPIVYATLLTKHIWG